MDVLEIVLAVLLLFCFVGAASLSAVETSIIRVRRSEVLIAANDGDRSSQRLLQLLDDLPAVLNTVLLLVLLSQVAASAIGGFLAARWFGGLGVTAMTVVMTGVLFVYAEAIPKTRAISAPKRTAIRSTSMLRALTKGLRPVVGGLVRLADLQIRAEGATFGAATETELLALSTEAAEAGQIEEEDAELIERSFEFNDCRLADVMVQRAAVVSVDADLGVSEALDVAIAAGHRRLPVCRHNDPDEIVGLVRLRDLAEAGRQTSEATAGAVMGPVLRSGQEDPISETLNRMQRAGSWMTVVVDDDGLVIGLATIEDIVAELVGEIDDDR